MLARLHTVWPEAREGGYAATGFAVFAAAIVVALTATAVVVSLTQKEESAQVRARPTEREVRAETMSAIKNAATAMESWGVENGGAYIGACGGAASIACPPFDETTLGGPNNRLVENGLKLPSGVSVAVIRADVTQYCLQATHQDLAGYELYFASEVGAPSRAPCS